MSGFKFGSWVLAVAGTGLLAGCSTAQQKSPDVSAQVRQSLEQAGLGQVSVSQDRDKGIVTLSGNVPTDADKSRAESITKSVAANQIVADKIGVRPPGNEGTERKAESDLDSGIDHNLDAALVRHKMNHQVRHSVKNGVVTLKGTVNSPAKRQMAEKLANDVPNVKQVVNELQVKNQKATGTSRPS